MAQQRADDMSDDRLRVVLFRWMGPALQTLTLAGVAWSVGTLSDVRELANSMKRIEPLVYATKQEQDQRLFRFKANEDRLNFTQDQLRILGARLDAFQVDCSTKREHNK